MKWNEKTKKSSFNENQLEKVFFKMIDAYCYAKRLFGMWISINWKWGLNCLPKLMFQKQGLFWGEEMHGFQMFCFRNLMPDHTLILLYVNFFFFFRERRKDFEHSVLAL